MPENAGLPSKAECDAIWKVHYNGAVARDRDKLKSLFRAHAAALLCSKLNRTPPQWCAGSVTLGDRRRRSAQSLTSAARHRRAVKRALRHLKVMLAWANKLNTGVSS